MPSTQQSSISRYFLWLAGFIGILLAFRQSDFAPIPLVLVSVLSLAMVACGLQKHSRISAATVVFIAVYLGSLLLNLQPATGIRLQRFAAFAIGMLAFSPLITNDKLSALRNNVIQFLVITLAVMVWISLPLWIYATIKQISIFDNRFYYYGFRGIFVMGMTLAPATVVVALAAADMSIKEGVTRHLRILAFATCLVALILCVAAGSRACLLGLLAASALLGYLRRKRICAICHRTVKAKYAIGAIAILILLAALPFSIKVLSAKMELASMHNSIFSSREYIWQARWTEFKASPIIGIGYAREFPKAADADTNIHGTTTADLTKIEPGSSYLSLLSYGGILGATSFLWVLWSVLGPYIKKKTTTVPLLPENANNPENTSPSSKPGDPVDSGNSIDSINYIDSGNSINSIGSGNSIGSYNSDRALDWSLLLFLAINAITEGWLFYAGSLLFPIFWITLSRLSRQSKDSMY